LSKKKSSSSKKKRSKKYRNHALPGKGRKKKSVTRKATIHDIRGEEPECALKDVRHRPGHAKEKVSDVA